MEKHQAREVGSEIRRKVCHHAAGGMLRAQGPGRLPCLGSRHPVQAARRQHVDTCAHARRDGA